MSQPLKIFIVEDDEWYRKLLEHTFSLNPDHQVKSFENGQSVLKELNNKPDIITLDYRLPDFDGSQLFDEVKARCPEAKVIVISEQQDIEVAVSLLRKGASDYLTKTEDIRDRIIHLVNQIVEKKQLEQKVDSLQSEVEAKYNFQSSIIGNSPKIKQVYRLIEKATTTNITVMLSGETGTGKEVAAKAIHYNSKFRKNAFVPVNMSAIPKDLVESELFGHEKGSFTGATEQHIGKFEQATGGTIFLDEIGELEISLQAKLLRVLQEQEVTRVGGKKPIQVNCRVIVATHRDLVKMMKEGTFREDLYYRLYGLQINMPPLRERGNDILLLANHFCESFCEQNGFETKKFSPDAKRKLLTYAYPGNIRELKSIVELSVVMSDENVIQPDDISFAQRDITAEIMAEELTMKEYQLKIIRRYIDQYEDIQVVADKLDIGKSTIYRLLKENPV